MNVAVRIGGRIKTLPFTIQTPTVFDGKVFSGKLGLCGFSEHQQVSWPLTVKAVTNRRKTSMLTDTALRNLKPKSKTYKAFDRDGMYVTVSPVGTVTFRYDYRLNGRRETLTIGRYGPAGLVGLGPRKADRRHKAVALGKSPALEKQREKRRLTAAKTFGEVTEKWLAPEWPTAPRRCARASSIILPAFQNRQLNEITADDLRALCNKVKRARCARDRGTRPRHRETGLCLRHPAW